MDQSSDSVPRIALVHPWVLQARGGERTFFDIVDLFPTADVFLLHCDRSKLPPRVEARLAGTSFLDRSPYNRLSYRSMLPLLPKAVASLDLSGYDIVISSSFGWAHGVTVPDDAVHISYVYSPPRYLWGEEAPTRSARAMGPALRPLIRRLRNWDFDRAQRVDEFIAISSITAERILESYGRESRIVFPPVDTHRYSSLTRNPDGHLISIGELVPYKRYDLAVLAANAMDTDLVVVGDGPERPRLEELAKGGHVRIAGRVSNAELEGLLSESRALIHPGIEDFGIVMVEALAAGVPVVGPRFAGAADIVSPPTGSLAADLTVEAYVAAIADVDSRDFDDRTLRERASVFSREVFADRFLDAVTSAVGHPIPTRPTPLPPEYEP